MALLSVGKQCVGFYLEGNVSEVDWIGHACATGYGVVIPFFLALLFAKQHLTMQQCKTFFAQSDNKEEVTLQLQVLNAAESLEDGHVVAAAMKLTHVYIRHVYNRIDGCGWHSLEESEI